MSTFQCKPKVNILVMPVKEKWQAKVFRKDNAMMVYESGISSDGLAVCEEARRWVAANRYAIGLISGIQLPAQPAPAGPRAYSTSWSGRRTP